MLVLTRKQGESIVIADDIVVRVTSIQGNRVKIAIDAPRSRRILRGEIAEQQRMLGGAVTREGTWAAAEGARPVHAAPLSHAK